MEYVELSRSRGQSSVIKKGTSVTEFFARFPNEQTCLEHVFSTRLGDHTPCPACDVKGGFTYIKGTKKYQHRCRQQVSVLKDTIFYRSNISLMGWFYGCLLFANSNQGIPSSFIRKQLGLGLKASLRLCYQIRLQTAFCNRPERLGGPGKMVYVDETMVKYVNSNRPEKTPYPVVMGMACDGQVLSGIIPDRTHQTFLRNIERFVEPGSVIVTDGHASYRRLKKLGWDHIVVNHLRAFHDFKGNNTANIDVYWSVLKRTMRKYVQASPEHFWTYLALIEFYYNRRDCETPNFHELIGSFPEVTRESTAAIKKRFVWE